MPLPLCLPQKLSRLRPATKLGMTVMELDEALAARLPAFFHSVAAATQPLVDKYFRQDLTVDHKSDDSPVTIADKEIEQAIRAQITAAFPDHHIIGEEFGGTAQDGFNWVIDPIDGTRAFISGKPTFGTLLGLTYQGVPVAGMINMPALSQCYIGILGQAPQARMNDMAVHVRATTELAAATIATTSPDAFTPTGWARYHKLSQLCGNGQYGGDCFNYALLAEGMVDLVIEHTLAAHDVMALVPVIQAAGGVVTDWSGQPVTLDNGSEILAAATPALHQAAMEHLSS